MRFILIQLLILCCWNLSHAQALKAVYTTEKITVDGKLDEAVWGTAESVNEFWQHFPTDTARSTLRTEAKIVYNDQFIYFGAIMYGKPDRKYVIPSQRRDFRGPASDAITLTLDTYMDQTNAFQFGSGPSGVQREGLIANGGSVGEDLSLNWDNRWYVETSIGPDYWIAEFAIPLKSLRFRENESQWRVKIYRIDSEAGERCVWPQTPRNLSIFSLAQTGILDFGKALSSPGPNISLIPYAAAGLSRNFQDNEPLVKDFNVGTDAKIGLGPALNLDLTFNPDFSQVEVDEQVTNLDRFEIFFPERRQFFLENADLFANFGMNGMRPFFSRRIGVVRDSSTGQNLQNKIYFGARLSGKLNNNLRVGLLTMQAGKDNALKIPSTNYTVLTLQQKLFSRSNISFIVVNKQAFQDSIGGDLTLNPDLQNRLVGADFNLASKNSTWNGKLFYHHSFDKPGVDSAYATGLGLNYNTAIWSVDFLARTVGANYNPEVGYARRTDFMQNAATVTYRWYPQSNLIQRHGPGFDYDVVGNKKYGYLDWDLNILYNIAFQNTSEFSLRLRRQYTFLFSDFDPSGTGGTALPAESGYAYNLIVARFSSNQRRRLFYELSTRSGQYFNGTRLNLEGTLNFRSQPYSVLSMNFSVNKITLPKPYSSGTLLLFGPKIDLTFSKKLFWTTFLQYNNQINNVNINSRLQWRFRPVSDLFLVYTDNYATESYTDNDGRIFTSGQPKLRAIVLKFSYWLNL